MTFPINRRSLLLGASAMGTSSILGLTGMPLTASENTPKRGGNFKVGISAFSSTDSLDPALINTKFQIMLNWQLRNNLIEIGPNGTLQPELAESWDVSADQKQWIFKLREGVEFHNAKTMTAEDVAYSINLHRGEKTKSVNKAMLSDVTDVTASAPSEVTVTLANPNAAFASILSMSGFAIVPKDHTDFDAGIGTGGYILESFEVGNKSVARRNPNYWKSNRANFDSVEILAIKDTTARTTALQTGQIHAMNFVDPTTANLLKRHPKVELIQTPGKAHYAFAMQTNTDPYTDLQIRQALKLAINRQEIVDKILGGYGTIGNDQPISSAYEYHNADLPQAVYDPDKARSLMAAAGASDAKLKLHVSETPFAGAVNTAQLFSEQAALAGINIEVVREPEDGYWANIWGKRPFFASRWSGRANEDLMLSSTYTDQALNIGRNETKWSNERFNTVVVEARSEQDKIRRSSLYHEAQTLIKDEGGTIIPAFADFIDAKAKNVAHGEVSSEWDLDGLRCSERWWFNP